MTSGGYCPAHDDPPHTLRHRIVRRSAVLSRSSGNVSNVPTGREGPTASTRGVGSASTAGLALLRPLQLAVAVWLLISPFVLAGPNALVAAKDVAVGTVLLLVTVAAAVDPRARRIEGRICVVLGVLLIAASVLLEFGSGNASAARQWNEVAIGVLLVYLAAARAT